MKYVEDLILSAADAIRSRRQRADNERDIARQQEIDRQLAAREPFAEDQLVYAAYSRCCCGAGLAYPKGQQAFSKNSGWFCSALLKREDRGEEQHDGMKPWAFWEIKSENQPSARGATTRPTARN